MPDHHPSCVEIAEKLHVQYEVWYDVMHAPKDLAEKLADEIQSECLRLFEQTSTYVWRTFWLGSVNFIAILTESCAEACLSALCVCMHACMYVCKQKCVADGENSMHVPIYFCTRVCFVWTCGCIRNVCMYCCICGRFSGGNLLSVFLCTCL